MPRNDEPGARRAIARVAGHSHTLLASLVLASASLWALLLGRWARGWGDDGPRGSALWSDDWARLEPMGGGDEALRPSSPICDDRHPRIPEAQSLIGTPTCTHDISRDPSQIAELDQSPERQGDEEKRIRGTGVRGVRLEGPEEPGREFQ